MKNSKWITQTWDMIKNNIFKCIKINDELIDDGFSGGGVSIYVHKSLNVSELIDLSCNDVDLEYVFV